MLLGIFSVSALFRPLEVPGQPFPTSAITLENQRPGTSAWQLTKPAPGHQIEGYASLTSVNRGGQIRFFVNTASSNYVFEIFRFGWYGGAGGRRVLGPLTLPGVVQPQPPIDPSTGLIECNWAVSYTLNVPGTPDPTDWPSGVYLIKLTENNYGFQSYIIFVVRDDARSSDLLAQLSFTTYQAYNNWGGKSLYGFNSAGPPARKVSFNRPFASYQASSPYWVGTGEFLVARYIGAWECNLVRWLEREGYDVSYCSSLDTHSFTNLLWGHQGFIVMGHDEYWSYPMRWNVQAARDRGVNLAFLSGNTCYWQVRFEPSSINGADARNMVCYKSTNDPVYLSPSNYLTTVNFRSYPVLDPEATLLGIASGATAVVGDFFVSNPTHWIYTNTGVSAGQRLPGLLGYEVDGTNTASPPGLSIAGASPFYWGTGTNNLSVFYTHAASYSAPGGATVFNSGTMQWNWGLDDLNVPATRSESYQNPTVQHITRNILARLLNHPPPSPTAFFRTDLGTEGNWKGNYGKDAVVIPGVLPDLPVTCSLNVTGADSTVILASSNDTNALQTASGVRSLSAWSSQTNFTIDLNFSDSLKHQVALYLWDWNNLGRKQQVDLLDGNTLNLLDRRSMENFTNGQWWVWQVSGHVKFRFSKIAGIDAVASALMIGSGADAAFVSEDSATQSAWKSVYGTDGYFIAANADQPPGYGSAQGIYENLQLWNPAAGDGRGLESATSTNCILSDWESTFNIQTFIVRMADDAWHQLALYFIDADKIGRKQTVCLLDARNNAVLDTREMTDFQAGRYLVWNIRGSTKIRIQRRGPGTATASGIFFGPPNQPPLVMLTSPSVQAFNLPTNIIVAAKATDTDGSISQVSFFADGSLVATLTDPPYVCVWTNALVGQHTLTAVAMDNRAASSTSAPVTIFVSPPADYQPPTVRVVDPPDGAVFMPPTNVTLLASVQFTSAPPVSVQFLVDGAPFEPPLSNAPFTLDTTNLYTGVHFIRAMVTDAFGVVVTSPGNRVVVLPTSAIGVFRQYGFTAHGDWIGVFGSEGYWIADYNSSLPNYFTTGSSGVAAITWNASTSDPRALAKPTGTDRFAGAWYGTTNWTLDINVLDGNRHRIALYLLDWENQGGVETVQLLNGSSGAMLDSRNVTNFQNGVYLIWEIGGHVQFQFSRSPAGAARVLSGFFLDRARSSVETHNICPTDHSFFAFPTNILISTLAYPGSNNLSHVDFLANGVLLGSSVAGPPYSFTWTNPAPGTYAIATRAVDAASAAVTSPTVSVTVEPAAAAAFFLGSNGSIQGNWRGQFGQQGHAVAGDNTIFPAYALVSNGSPVVLWSSVSSDPRALQRDAGNSRVAAAWYSNDDLILDIKFLDADFHRMELYFLDWYNLPGTQTIKVEDVVTGVIIDQHTMFSFPNGLWVSWSLRGHVRFHLTRTGSAPAIVSGIFFDPASVLPAISITSPAPGDVFTAPASIAVRADAAVDTNNVQRVDFYDAATLLGSTANGPPFTFVWTNAQVGRHTLIAREVGPAAAADSAPVVVNVFNSTDLAFFGIVKSWAPNLVLDAFAPSGATVRLEARSRMDGTATWVPIATNTSGSNHLQFVLPDPSSYPQRFYRMRMLQ